MNDCRTFVTKFGEFQTLEGATEHSQLYGRDEPDQHPIGAIAGLTEKLEGITANRDSVAAVAASLSQHSNDKGNPHEVTAEQTGALGLSVAATCEDEAASPTSTPNTWYVPKTMPKPTGEAGMMIDVFWANGHTGGLGYNVSLVWGEPGGAANETIISGASVTDSLTGEVSIPTEGTVRYQLIDRSGRLTFKYVSGPVLLRQYSTDAAADAADKPIRGMELEYLPGMEIYVALDKGNTAPTMRLVPDSGPALPVYGNASGTATGDIPTGYICHLVNAEDHWQLVNAPGNDAPAEVSIGSAPAVPPEGTKINVDPNAAEITLPDVLQTTGDSIVDTMSQKAITQLSQQKADKLEYKKMQDITITTDGEPLEITADSSGKPFSLVAFALKITFPSTYRGFQVSYSGKNQDDNTDVGWLGHYYFFGDTGPYYFIEARSIYGEWQHCVYSAKEETDYLEPVGFKTFAYEFVRPVNCTMYSLNFQAVPKGTHIEVFGVQENG